LSENCKDKKKSYFEGHLDYGTSTGFGERRRSEEKVLTAWVVINMQKGSAKTLSRWRDQRSRHRMKKDRTGKEV
jgi:hypothetical protein